MATRNLNTPKNDLHGQETPASKIVVGAPAAQGAMDYAPFIWQQLGDIQKSLGALHSAVDGLKETAISTKNKVQELSGLRNKFVGGMVVLGILVTGASELVIWAANKVWNTFGELAKPAIAQVIQVQAMQGQSDGIALAPELVSSQPARKQ
jgi:hypothetical protein